MTERGGENKTNSDRDDLAEFAAVDLDSAGQRRWLPGGVPRIGMRAHRPLLLIFLIMP